ncbi:MAG: RdgB/HAM1 family non-canonical purine NTP pyrophosphatase [Micrococcales bacterium]|nr:RdgB/HAM1 family non-canonical purine NTP pyrophosphatase [Micrococcales bacterium]
MSDSGPATSNGEVWRLGQGRHRAVLATHNSHKVREVSQVLDQAGALAGWTLVTAGELDLPVPVEDGVTFLANAQIKARAACQASGLVALAEDSGLCVEVLGGAPGVFSARWAGGHGDDGANLALLVDQLADVPPVQRGAWFECVAVAVFPDGREVFAAGRMPGRLATEPAGDGGFGYDPILIPDGMDLTSAQLAPSVKNAISHRGQAWRALAAELAKLGL